MHETTWKPKTLRTAPPERYPATQNRQENGRGSASRWCRCRFSKPLVSEIPGRRRKGLKFPSSTGTANQTFRISKRAALIHPGRKPLDAGLFHGSLDFATSIPGYQKPVWYSVSSLPYLENLKQPGYELPETGTPGSSKGRTSHSALEALQMAPYKKKLKSSMPTWSLSTKAGFCLSQMSSAHGHSGDKPHAYTISIRKTGYQPSMLFPCRPKGNDSLSIYVCVHTTLTAWMFAHSCSIFSGIFAEMSLSFGIAEAFTKGGKSNNTLNTTPAYRLKGSRHMPQNSTRLSMFGTWVIPPLPIVPIKISKSFNIDSAMLCTESADHRIFSGHASILPICHGPEINLHYLCNTQ